MSRPEKPINWKLVDELLIAGCLGTEIAPHFDMHPNTFYERVTQKFGVSFTEYSGEKRSVGDACLRKVQYDKAIEKDNSMLIWLGKNRLSQRDKFIDEIKELVVDEIRSAVKDLKANAGDARISGSELAPQPPVLHQGQPREQGPVQAELGTEDPLAGFTPV